MDKLTNYDIYLIIKCLNYRVDDIYKTVELNEKYYEDIDNDGLLEEVNLICSILEKFKEEV